MNEAAVFGYVGLACGVIFIGCLIAAVWLAGRDARRVGEEWRAERRRFNESTEEYTVVPCLVPTVKEVSEFRAECEAVTREAAMR